MVIIMNDKEHKVKYGTNLFGGFGISDTEQLPIIKETGFDAFFTGWSRADRSAPLRLAEAGSKAGLFYETVHAPFGRMNSMWLDGGEGDDWRDMMIECVDDTAAAGVGIMVTHVTVAAVAPPPSEIGRTRFLKLAEHAAKRGVKIALENLEIPEHLAYLFEKLDGLDNIGFCWDTGHNLCYTPETDMMELYGDKLICLHINDNNGIKTPGVITWHDDSHFMPFDGRVDWQGVANRLDAAGWQGFMTQEMSRGKDGCEKIEAYSNMTLREYLEKSLGRLQKIGDLRRRG